MDAADELAGSAAPLWGMAPERSFEVLGGDALPVVVHVPHAGLHIPPSVRDGIMLDDEALAVELGRMTDHRTDVLAGPAAAAGATVFVNRLSRLVVDPERFLDPAQETMEARGMGAVYARTSSQQVLRHLTDAVRDDFIDRYFEPYTAALTRVVDAVVARHATAVVIDLHSYPSQRLAYEIGGTERPEVCIGTDASHTPPGLLDTVERIVAAAGLQCRRDTPFAGTYVPTAHLGSPKVTSVMLEIRRDLYLDERTLTPSVGEVALAAMVREVTLAVAVDR